MFSKCYIAAVNLIWTEMFPFYTLVLPPPSQETVLFKNDIVGRIRGQFSFYPTHAYRKQKFRVKIGMYTYLRKAVIALVCVSIIVYLMPPAVFYTYKSEKINYFL